MWRCVGVVRTDGSEERVASIFLTRVYIFYPEDGGDTFLRNVGFTRPHTVPQPQKAAFFEVIVIHKVLF
jgi:hypothetical protein